MTITGAAPALNRTYPRLTSPERNENDGVRRQSAAPYTHLQSRRDCVLQPRVARNELPWDQRRQNQFQPRMRLCRLRWSRPAASCDCVTNWRNSFGVEMNRGNAYPG